MIPGADNMPDGMKLADDTSILIKIYIGLGDEPRALWRGGAVVPRVGEYIDLGPLGTKAKLKVVEVIHRISDPRIARDHVDIYAEEQI